ncbi:MAG: hypothetical protein IMF12_08870, partial [Proteobacteria bacterium]|nr:hypothetical protein [Pseudomonadota bacterium]
LLSCWLLGIGLGYSCLFGLGELIFANWLAAMIYIFIAIVCMFSINKLLKNGNIL